MPWWNWGGDTQPSGDDGGRSGFDRAYGQTATSSAVVERRSSQRSPEIRSGAAGDRRSPAAVKSSPRSPAMEPALPLRLLQSREVRIVQACGGSCAPVPQRAALGWAAGADAAADAAAAAGGSWGS
jgi:hypothetical protein